MNDSAIGGPDHARAPRRPAGLRIRIATLFGVGHFPIASGTAGSAVTLPLAAALTLLGSGGYLLGMLVVIGIALWSADAAEAHFGLKDPHDVVIDETAGQIVALALIPLSLGWYAAGFVLFRIFDVVKPFPARRLERIKGGAGIVLDDLAAGLYANLILQSVRVFTHFGASA